MSDKHNLFDPEKISIIDFKMVKGQVDTSEDFDPSKIEGYHLDNGLQFGFSQDEKLVKADFTIEIKTESKGDQDPEIHDNPQQVLENCSGYKNIKNEKDVCREDCSKVVREKRD